MAATTFTRPGLALAAAFVGPVASSWLARTTGVSCSPATKLPEGGAPSSQLRADFSKFEVASTRRMRWAPSPSASVWRKRLELSGPAEAGRVTSVVQYAAASTFHEHGHPDGEEILVLRGTFSDDSGDYP
ncbi:unnamed protein product, partial [Symbiodinium sp. KB8]